MASGISSNCQNMPDRNIIGCPTACATPAAVSESLAQAPMIKPMDEKRTIPANMRAMAIGVTVALAPNT